MNKHVIIVNGSGGVGKDTICALAAKYYRTRNISSITPIVQIARSAGWDGVKTPASRRLLSRLKEAFTEFNDLSFQYCMQQYTAFLTTDEQLLFVHIREPEEIARLRAAIGPCCRTLLVRRQALEARGPLGNRSDDCVEHYAYDYYFENNGPLEHLEDCVHAFFESILQNTADNLAPVDWHFDK